MHPLLPVFSNRNVSTDPGQFFLLLTPKSPLAGHNECHSPNPSLLEEGDCLTFVVLLEGAEESSG
jgi:hypothetical protein